MIFKDCENCTVRRCTSYLNSGGIGDILPENSSFIGRGLHASTIGPFLRLSRSRPLPISNATVHDATDIEGTTPVNTAQRASRRERILLA